MEKEVKERAESRYGQAERKGQKRTRGKAGEQTHTHTNGKLLMRNKTTVMRVILRGPFNVPDENMKERKTRAV